MNEEQIPVNAETIKKLIEDNKKIFRKEAKTLTKEDRKNKKEYLKAIDLAGKFITLIYEDKKATDFRIGSAIGLTAILINEMSQNFDNKFLEVIIAMINGYTKDKKPNITFENLKTEN